MTSTRLHLMRGALRQIWRFPLRSSLMLTCAALGVAGATASVNYAAGGRAQVLQKIERLGTNLVVISAEQSRAVAGRARTGSIVTTLTEADYRAVRGAIAGISRSSALVSGGLRLKAGYSSKVSPVIGVEPDFFGMKSWPVVAGEAFDDVDLRRSARVVLLGHGVAGDLFPDGDALGQRLFINRVPFEVRGVLAERGQGLDTTNEDQQVYVPLTTAMRRLFSQEHYSSLVLEMEGPQALQAATRDVTALLRQRHRISELRPDDFRVGTQQDLIRTQTEAADRLRFLVSWIGRSALFVAGLGILAIAWTAVRDRTREIGTRRALGARAGDIYFQFAFEALVLAVAGAAGGLLIGWLASRLLATQSGLPFIFDGANAALAFVVACALNLAFASWPAWRAAQMDPIQALRHD